MAAEIPSIHVYNETTQIINRPGLASKIALIGAFDSAETEPVLCMSVREAQTKFGTSSDFDGCTVIEDLFIGASSLLCVNTNVRTTSGDVTTDDKTLTTQKLTTALSKIKGEDFDILFIAYPMTDTFLPIITEFLDECFEMKMPCGFVYYIASGTTSAKVTTAGLSGDHCYGILVQNFKVNNATKNILKSCAYYTGLLAGMNVGNTMTMKVVNGVTKVNPTYTFETGDDGKALVEAGITIIKPQNRDGRYIVVNSEQPNGYDLYINRVRDYVVKEMALHQFLGERNRQATLEEIEQELERVKEVCVDTLDLLEDINYTVEKGSSNCVIINIDSLLFAGIITQINVYLRVEVE